MGNKTRLQMRTDLAIDLKITIDTELSANELNRSIERSVADFNRFLPDEKIYEDSLQFSVADEEVVFPKEADADAIVADEDLSTIVAGDTLTDVEIDGQPDVPRPLRLALTDDNNSIQGMTIIISGIDKDDQSVQEIFHYSIGDSKIIVGAEYFKTVYLIEIDQIAGNGASDVLNIGFAPHTDVWVYLANSPIRRSSDSATNDDDSDATVVKNTDYYIDYANGRVKAISGGGIAQGETCTFAYSKYQIGIDISGLPGLIRVQRVEYPVGEVPQTFVSNDVFGKYVFVTGTGESGEQARMAEDQQYRIYYDAVHQAPGEYAPGTIPIFLENTVETMAGAYALYILALKQEHQTATDITSARTALGNATGTHSALALALADVEKYLDDNEDESGEDAAAWLKKITTDIASLRAATGDAMIAMNSYLDVVGTATTGDLAKADLARENYMGTTANYVDHATTLGIKKYLDDGDATLNTVPVGGEGQDVPRAYREYAQTVKEALVAAHERDRQFYQQNATARTNAAMVFGQEAAQRISNLRTYLEQVAGYNAIANTFAAKAGHYLSQVMSYLQQASQYVVASNSDIALADRFRAEANERRNEVYSIWRDRRQYIGDFTAGSMRQMPDYNKGVR